MRGKGSLAVASASACAMTSIFLAHATATALVNGRYEVIE
jgi:hypothetical protein